MNRWIVRVVSLFALIAGLTMCATARAEPVRILIAAGASAGLSTDPRLSHAESDASGVRDVFMSYGWVRPDHAILLPNPNKAALFGAFDRARALAQKHPAREVMLVVYFSGHGDYDALRMNGENVPLSELSAKVAQFPAAFRMVVIDACRTKEVSHSKGMNAQPGFEVQLSEPLVATGSVWVHASSDGEAAQESDEIGGALFTHFWLAGLRGAADTNGDSRVTLDESFAYARAQTLFRSARSGGVLQHPEAKLDVSERESIVLTEIGADRAQLEFPREADALYLVYALGSKNVIAEVFGATERNVRIALPKGRYLVQKRTGARGAIAELTLAANTTRALSSSDFRSVSPERLAQKGGVVVYPLSVGVADTLWLGRGVDFGNELFVRFEWRDLGWGVALSPLGGFAKRRTDFNEVEEWSVGGDLSLEYLLPAGSDWLFRAGLDARGQWIWQSARRTDAARLELAGFTSDQLTKHTSGSAWGGGLHAGARYALASHLYVDIALRGLALGVKTDTGAEGRVLGGLSLGLGIPF